jgi:RimJ/RimL family protein N-acetyltransferase
MGNCTYDHLVILESVMLLVYKLLPHDYGRYRKHLLALDAASRYNRFAYSITDEMINKLCDEFEANPLSHKIFVIENDDLDIVGVGHISLEGETELAFSVLKEYQNQGYGSALMARCIEWLQNRSIKQTHMTCLATNSAVRKLAAKHGVLVNDHGEVLADITIPDPNPLSVMHEVFDSSLARFDHLGKLQRKFARTSTLSLLFK